MYRKLILVTAVATLALAACSLGGAPAGQTSYQKPTKPPVGVEESTGALNEATTTPEQADQPEQPQEPAPDAGEEEPAPEEPQPEHPTAEPEPVEEAPTEEPQPEAPAPDEPVVIEVPDITAEAFEQAWRQAYELPPGVPFSVTMTEAQIEARIAQAMAASGYNVSEVDVSLDNGQIGVTFGVSMTVGATGRSVNAQAELVFAVSVDGNGDIVVNVVSAKASAAVGSVDIPPEMLTALNAAINQAISGADVAAQSGVDVTFTGVVIDNGAITVSGYVTPL
jgi:hypothetical protein